MPGPTKFTLRALRSLRRMPLPDRPQVRGYGAIHVGEGHDVLLFPSVLREAAAPQVDTILEEGQSTCFFHPKLPASEVCALSGRLICDLCRTEWNGQTVSFEALQKAVKNEGPRAQGNTRTRWDNIALHLAILPLLLWFLTLVTAPVALFIALWQGRKGRCSVVQRSGWRYLLAGALALLQIAFWVFLFTIGFSFQA